MDVVKNTFSFLLGKEVHDDDLVLIVDEGLSFPRLDTLCTSSTYLFYCYRLHDLTPTKIPSSNSPPQ